LVTLLAYEAYIVGLAFVMIVFEETLFASVAGTEYLRARAEAEELVKRLRDEAPRSRRSVSKALTRLRVVQASLKKLLLLRLVLLLLVYLSAALFTAFRAGLHILPVGCCIPGLSVPVGDEGGCFTTVSLLLASSFLAALPLVQEDVIVLLLRRPGRGG
jgi:hypothetical protein